MMLSQSCQPPNQILRSYSIVNAKHVLNVEARDEPASWKEAGLKGKSAHGLRKSVAQRLALNSHSTNEIAAIGGWETLSEVQRYTKGANRRVLAEQVKRKRR